MNEYTQAYRVEGGVMQVKLAGTFPNELLRSEGNLFAPLIENCKENNCRKAVVDARDLEVDFDTVALFRAGVDASDLHSFGLRVALVARKEMISSFFDDVTHNRGAPVQVFSDMEAACAWLDVRR